MDPRTPLSDAVHLLDCLYNVAQMFNDVDTINSLESIRFEGPWKNIQVVNDIGFSFGNTV
jgi:hypothetical protein